MLVFPNAKINLGLHIVSRRPDGYHNIETVFYPVQVKDALEVVEAGELKFSSSGLEIPGAHSDNLCIKAYKMLAHDFALPPVHIHIHKHIPVGAGLGGGSSDAAFFLKLMNEKFALGMDNEQMQGYCRQLGADCAFFLENQPLYAYDKGDRFGSAEVNLENKFIVLVMPPVTVSTGEAYRGVRPEQPQADIREILTTPVGDWSKTLKNDFEASVFQMFPQIRGVKSALYEAGARYASMSGSGSSVYGIFDEPVKLPGLEEENQVFYGV